MVQDDDDKYDGNDDDYANTDEDPENPTVIVKEYRIFYGTRVLYN